MNPSSSPLHSAVCVAKLLERGANIDAVNKAGMTPLHEVCLMGAKEVADLLLDSGANIDQLSAAGESCLFLLLSRRPKASDGPLLSKLCTLSFPLRLRDYKGRLPSTWTQADFSKQRERLLLFITQPRKLQDICKRFIYLKHNLWGRETLRGILPPGIYDFVFNYWEDLHISPSGGGGRGFSSNLFDNALL